MKELYCCANILIAYQKNVSSKFLSSHIHTCVIWNLCLYLSLSNTQGKFWVYYSWWVHDWIDVICKWIVFAVWSFSVNRLIHKTSPNDSFIKSDGSQIQLPDSACFWSVHHTNLSNEFRRLLRSHRIHMNHFYGRFMLLWIILMLDSPMCFMHFIVLSKHFLTYFKIILNVWFQINVVKIYIYFWSCVGLYIKHYWSVFYQKKVFYFKILLLAFLCNN